MIYLSNKSPIILCSKNSNFNPKLNCILEQITLLHEVLELQSDGIWYEALKWLSGGTGSYISLRMGVQAHPPYFQSF